MCTPCVRSESAEDTLDPPLWTPGISFVNMGITERQRQAGFLPRTDKDLVSGLPAVSPPVQPDAGHRPWPTVVM